MKILICDDDRDFRAMLYFHLHKSGHEVLSVSDAVHAVALLGDPDHAIELVILDLTMPRLSGVEIMETFSRWSMCKTNFIVVSGDLDPKRFENHDHVIGCLAKPFSLQALDGLIGKLANHEQGLGK
jgi:DNA-binding response OmpR family regulator